MTASSRWTLSRPSLTAALIWSLSPALLSACGIGNDVDMGRLTLSGSGGGGGGSGGGGGQAGSGMCSGPCADFTGTRVFVESSATAGAADAFVNASVHPNGTDKSLEPALLYPSHETRFPVNLTGLRFSWTGAEGSLFALDFTGTKTDVRVITGGTAWVPDATEWDWIAESNRGGDVTVVAHTIVPARPTEAWTSLPITLSFSRDAVEGAIYYWSTGSQSVMKALLSDQTSLSFYTDPEGADALTSTGGHTLSRDGKRMAAGYGDRQLREISVPDRQVILPVNGGTAGGTDPNMMKMAPPDKAVWTTFSPDGSLLLVAAGGKLTLLDANTGMPVGPEAGVVPLPPGTLATHPDWSPLGTQIAVTLAGKGGDKSTEGGEIALLSYNAGSFGTPDVIVPKQGDPDNNYFPSFSPDSRFVAYVNASGKSDDAKSASLRLVEVASRKVTELTRLNQRLNSGDGVLNLGNSMPSWAPATTPGAPFWLAFASSRPYAEQPPLDKMGEQIWIAAIDPSLPDPSFAAFWAPFQSLEQSNERAVWTHDEKDWCGCVEVCGDGLDNDCNGSADEAGCAEKPACMAR